MMKKKLRKGFTLVEILIVIIILGTLTATMMIESKGSIGATKANSIIANMSIIKDAVLAFYIDKLESNPRVSDFQTNSDVKLKYLGDFAKITGDDKVMTQGAITYVLLEKTDDTNKWYVKADFSSDFDKDKIAEQLKKQASNSKVLGEDYKEYASGTTVLMQIK